MLQRDRHRRPPHLPRGKSDELIPAAWRNGLAARAFAQLVSAADMIEIVDETWTVYDEPTDSAVQKFPGETTFSSITGGSEGLSLTAYPVRLVEGEIAFDGGILHVVTVDDLEYVNDDRVVLQRRPAGRTTERPKDSGPRTPSSGGHSMLVASGSTNRQRCSIASSASRVTARTPRGRCWYRRSCSGRRTARARRCRRTPARPDRSTG